MIGLDTNAVLRWLVGDDPDQAALVERMMMPQGDAIFINPVVLAEVVWVLARRAGLDRPSNVGLLRELLDNPGIVIAHRDEVVAATEAYGAGGPGFSDHLIGALNAGAGCATTLTFDKRAAKSRHFTALT